jgi:SAM-dependent methyltransferase
MTDRTETPDRYIHGRSPEEVARLALLNDLLNEGCLRELALRGGERILDVGAGQGQLSRAMARAAGRAVVAVERHPEQIAEARRLAEAAGEAALLDLRQGEAAALPLAEGERGAFDVAHARFLLEHVPDPVAVVCGMVGAVRPGGRVVLADDDHANVRLHPEPAGFSTVWEAFVRSYDRLGHDPYVGRRLTGLLAQAGAPPVRISWVFFGACAGQAAFAGFAANLLQNLRGAREAVLAAGTLDGEGLDAALAALERWAGRPDAAIWYAVNWAEGRRGEG